ncbi:hypothetical protein IFM89_003934 [Coptis chinensis]|uniref:F-box domain-containing protein n=1 Tax=Coptis chinensis TaxID=261450 RepID=A0A835HTS9_9MAGN|nr:hypothetical protein IFM89_003934 [Coptis chinensis]
MAFNAAKRKTGHEKEEFKSGILPRDMMFDILSRLPIKPLARFSLEQEDYFCMIQKKELEVILRSKALRTQHASRACPSWSFFIRRSKRRKENVENMSNVLPHEIYFEIFSRLEVRSLLRLKQVCKLWCNLIRDPIFVNIHMNRAKENENYGNLKYIYRRKDSSLFSFSSDDNVDRWRWMEHPFGSSSKEIRVCYSCNGLLCLTCNDKNKTICLWNPVTRDHKVLPSPPTEDPPISFSSRPHLEYGFGYCRSTNDYEVVRVVSYCDYNTVHFSVAYVYSLAKDSWRKTQDGPCITGITGDGASGVLLNDSLHWIESHCSWNPRVVAFDIGGKEFRTVAPPDYKDSSFLKIAELGGMLGLLRYDRSKESYLEGWVMKGYGLRESWTKLVIVKQRIAYSKLCNFLPKNSLSKVSIDNHYEVLYHANSGTMFYLEVTTSMGVCIEPRTYIESLVGF